MPIPGDEEALRGGEGVEVEEAGAGRAVGTNAVAGSFCLSRSAYGITQSHEVRHC